MISQFLSISKKQFCVQLPKQHESILYISLSQKVMKVANKIEFTMLDDNLMKILASHERVKSICNSSCYDKQLLQQK